MNFNIIDKSVSKNNNLGLRERLQYIVDLIDKFEQLEKALDLAMKDSKYNKSKEDYLRLARRELESEKQ